MVALPTAGQSAGIFLGTYFATSAVSVAPILLSRNSRPKAEAALRKLLSASKRNRRLALLPVLLPLVFRSTQRFVEKHQHHLVRLGDAPIVQIIKDALPALLSSPLFLLLPASFRVHVALYSLSTLLYSFTRPKPHTVPQLEEGKSKRRVAWTKEDLKENWRDYLPPMWTVSSLSNAWLLWAFLYEHHAFPAGYSRIIVDHSRRYIPADRSLPDVLRILGNTDHPRSLPSSPHSFVVCEVLHPTQVSCHTNYIAACTDETRRALPWVAGFSALSMLASGKLNDIYRRTFDVGLEFIDSTFRGTVYISGTITTAWAFTCVLQRILPVGFLPRARWILNGSVPSMWILLLSRNRQVAISLYQFRMALHCAWKVWTAKGGRSIRHGDIWIIALCWIGLMQIKRKSETRRINGIIGQVMRLIDGTESQVPAGRTNGTVLSED